MTNSKSLNAQTTSKSAWENWEDENTTNIIKDKTASSDFFPNHNTRRGLTFSTQEDLVLLCFSRNPGPIKAFLAHVKETFHNSYYGMTIVKKPSPQGLRRLNSWQQVAERPIRNMATVVLDSEQKENILSDMNEFLRPETWRWYVDRGIPLRRGYLFHGPPGTGKTSLAFALAGVFGLKIHIISLLEPSLTEEDLGALFSNLPRRCIVLLEDIDTAGLGRPASKDHNEKTGICLSGLLNAIDGVASHEGRVLIMTTNDPGSLDEALIRPGRVDIQIRFTNATHAQIIELFKNIYIAKVVATTGAIAPIADSIIGISVEKRAAMAEAFANIIPAGKFSPSDVQGYLLRYKNDPLKAIDKAGKWVEGLF